MDNDIHVYLPEHCLQGEEITSHILWDKDTNVPIKIIIPADWEYVEIFNTKENKFSLKDNILIIYETEVSGYFAYKIKTNFYNVPKKIENVTTYILSDEDICITKEICLFRPDVKLIECPEEIIIKTKKNMIVPSKKIIINNLGEGAAYLSFEPDEDTDLTLVPPPNILDFVNKVWDDIETKSDKLIKNFPKNKDIIKQFLQIRKTENVLDDKNIEKIKKLKNNLENEFFINEDFGEQFSEAIFTSYFMNINMITLTPADIFLEFISTLHENRIYLINSLDYIDIKNPGIFKGNILIMDKGENEYESIPINVKISAENMEIPIYTLFNWSKGEL